jgi:hypothetical protein
MVCKRAIINEFSRPERNGTSESLNSSAIFSKWSVLGKNVQSGEVISRSLARPFLRIR